MTTAPGNKSPTSEVNPNDPSTRKPGSMVVRAWLILLTIIGAGTCFLTGGLALILGVISLYFLEDSEFGTSTFLTTQAILWPSFATMAALLLVGVGGGWRAFRKQRIRRAVGFSLLALLPIGLCAVGILIVLLTSSSPFPISVGWDP